MAEHETTAATGPLAANTHGATEQVDIGEHSAAFPPFDATTYGSQLLWLAITFGLLYYLMSKMALPRIANILEVRRDRIASDLGEAERLKRETDEAIASYEESLAQARQKAHAIAHTAREEAKAHSDAELKKVEASIAKQLSEADETISSVKQEAMSEVDAIAQSTTEAVLEAIMGSSVGKREINSAIKAAKAN